MTRCKYAIPVLQQGSLWPVIRGKTTSASLCMLSFVFVTNEQSRTKLNSDRPRAFNCYRIEAFDRTSNWASLEVNVRRMSTLHLGALPEFWMLQAEICRCHIISLHYNPVTIQRKLYSLRLSDGSFLALSLPWRLPLFAVSVLFQQPKKLVEAILRSLLCLLERRLPWSPGLWRCCFSVTVLYTRLILTSMLQNHDDRSSRARQQCSLVNSRVAFLNSPLRLAKFGAVHSVVTYLPWED